MTKKAEAIRVRLTEEVRREVREMSEQEDRPISTVARRLISEALEARRRRSKVAK